MKIAVDFDGTIVEHAYPKIGKEMAFAFSTLKELQKQQKAGKKGEISTRGMKLKDAVKAALKKKK